ncbi:hypothetical protein AD939_01185 [Gluconobacter oxydans]|nr:hypothetical protein AD939_01185 [Gluconobacter oxydans]KXV66766.1 hypothetical protein AD950_00995 [Gluconobacter oxydans]
MESSIWLLTLIHFRDQLRNAIDKDILVMDRREPFDARNDLNCIAIVLVSENASIRFSGKRENWMFHRGHIIFGDGIKDITNKKIWCRISFRK